MLNRLNLLISMSVVMLAISSRLDAYGDPVDKPAIPLPTPAVNTAELLAKLENGTPKEVEAAIAAIKQHGQAADAVVAKLALAAWQDASKPWRGRALDALKQCRPNVHEVVLNTVEARQNGEPQRLDAMLKRIRTLGSEANPLMPFVGSMLLNMQEEVLN